MLLLLLLFWGPNRKLYVKECVCVCLWEEGGRVRMWVVAMHFIFMYSSTSSCCCFCFCFCFQHQQTNTNAFLSSLPQPSLAFSLFCNSPKKSFLTLGFISCNGNFWAHFFFFFFAAIVGYATALVRFAFITIMLMALVLVLVLLLMMTLLLVVSLCSMF